MKKSKGGKKWRRLLSMLLTLTLIFSTCSINALADDVSNGNDSTVNDNTSDEYVDENTNVGLEEIQKPVDTTDENGTGENTDTSTDDKSSGKDDAQQESDVVDEAQEKDTIDEESKATEESTETNESEESTEKNTETITEESTETSTDDVEGNKSTNKKKAPAKATSVGTVTLTLKGNINYTYSWSAGTQNGTVYINDFTHYFASGTQVTVTVIVPSGYIFKGWYEDEDFNGNAISTTNPYTFTASENKTYYAKFAKEIVALTLKGNINYTYSWSTETQIGTATVGSTVVTNYFNEGTQVTVTADIPTGYRFDGWYDNEDFTGSAISTTNTYTFTASEDITYYAKFVERVSIKFKGNVDYLLNLQSGLGTTGIFSVNEYGVDYECDKDQDVAVLTVTASSDGYSFEGWYTDENYTDKVESENGVFKLDTTGEVKTYYAKFVNDQVTVTFLGNVDFDLDISDGQDTTGTQSVDRFGYNYTCDKGKEIEVSTVIPPSGYSFEGWYYDSNHNQPVDSEEIKDGKLTITVEENKKYYAKFIPEDIKVEISLSVEKVIQDDKIGLNYILTNGVVTSNENFVITSVHLAYLSNETLECDYNINLSKDPEFEAVDFRSVVKEASGDNNHELGNSNSAGKYTEWVSVDDNPELYQYAVGYITVQDNRFAMYYGESYDIYSNLIATTYGDIVAIVNGKYEYTSLDNAVNNENTKDGDKIELIADATSDSGDLSKLDITVENGATLTITGGIYNPESFTVEEGSKISITGGTFTSAPNEILKSWIEEGYHAFANGDGTYTVKEAVTVTAKNIDGKGEEATQVFAKGSKVIAKALASYTDNNTKCYFEGWYIENSDNRVSKKNEYIFTAKENVTLVANYTANVNEAKYVELSLAASQYDSTRILYEENHMVTGYDVVKAGILISTKESVKDSLVINDDGTVTKGVTNLCDSSPKATGYCSLKINVGSQKDRTIYARAYVVVKDDEGKEIIYYSDVISNTYNDLSSGKVKSIRKIK